MHGVAYRLAVRARRRTLQTLPAAVSDRAAGPPEGLAWREMLGILDHELGQLSDRYRAPLVLCYLEGRTQDEAARQLGWSLSTLRRRLAQGRRLLEARLRGRGVTLPAALAGLLAASAVAVPGPLRAATLAAAGARAVGGATAGASALSSARKGTTLLLSTSGKKIGAAVAVAALAAAVCFGYVLTTPANQPPAASEPPPTAEAPAAGAGPGDPAADPLPARGAVRLGTARYRHGSRIESMAVSADGRLAAASSGHGWFSGLFSPARVFDLTDGRCLYSLPNERGSNAEAVGLSPDGKTLAIGPDFPEGFSGVPVRLWDVATGQAGHELEEPMKLVDGPDEAGSGTTERSLRGSRWHMKSRDGRAFSPDGRLLIDWAEHPFGRSRIDHVYVWDAATGRAVATLSAGPRPGAANAAFAPDGRTLATASADGIVRLWEVATWQVRAEFRGHRDQVTALAFGPDGSLFTGGLDTVVLGWDVRPPRDAAKGTLADAWEALTEADGKAGFQAQGRFLAEPAQAVEWLAARVTPVHHPDPSRVKALIADLDNADFATRERATADLAEHGPAAAVALREVAAKSSSAEARRRAKDLLREMENGVLPPRELRALRAVEVLEWIATPEARALLLERTKGAPAARLTREAAAACKRLEGRK